MWKNSVITTKILKKYNYYSVTVTNDVISYVMVKTSLETVLQLF